jgi:hypothetical protein
LNILYYQKNLGFTPGPLMLNGDNLPWIDSAKYLGNTVNNVLDGHSRDCKQKRAIYIEKNCELNQEFF